MQTWTLFIILGLVWPFHNIMALSAPRNIAADGNNLTWDAPSDTGAGIKMYRVFRNGRLQQEVPASVTSLADDGEGHPYIVQAVDKAGAKAHARLGIAYWQKSFGGTGGDAIHAVATDSEDNVYAGGVFQGTVDFGTGPLRSENAYAFWLGKFAPDGVCIWSKRFTVTVASAVFSAIDVDASGNVFIGGNFKGTANFGGEDLVSAGNTDIFMARFTSNGNHVWSKRLGGSATLYGDSLAGLIIDQQGDIVIAGSFFESANFGGDWLGAAWTGFHPFVAKFNADGVHQWSKALSAPEVQAQLLGVSVDSQNNIGCTGHFTGTINFGGDTLAASGILGGGSGFVVKLNSTGSHLWSRAFAGGNQGYCIEVDSQDNFLVAGIFTFSSNFGGCNLSSPTGVDIFLAKYDADGNHTWSQSYGSQSHDQPYSLAVDSQDNVILTGIFSAPINFTGLHNESCQFVASYPLPMQVAYDSFVAKYDSAGTNIWVDRIGGLGNDVAWSVAVDSQDSVIVGGYFQSSVITIGGEQFSSAGSTDAFLYKRAP